jgi:hypothetical protein
MKSVYLLPCDAVHIHKRLAPPALLTGLRVKDADCSGIN